MTRMPARTARADPAAALFTVLAGIAGMLAILLPWIPTGGEPISGWSWILLIRSFDEGGVTSAVAAYGLLAIGLAGVTLVLFGFAMFLPVDHRPFGTVCLVLSLIMMGVTVWWLVRAQQLAGISPAEMFSVGGFGFACVPIAALLSFFGAIKALFGR